MGSNLDGEERVYGFMVETEDGRATTVELRAGDLFSRLEGIDMRNPGLVQGYRSKERPTGRLNAILDAGNRLFEAQ